MILTLPLCVLHRYLQENRDIVAGKLHAITDDDKVGSDYQTYSSAAHKAAEFKYRDVDEFETDLPMHHKVFLLPPGMVGTNTYFNEGKLQCYYWIRHICSCLTYSHRFFLCNLSSERVNQEDKCELQKYLGGIAESVAFDEVELAFKVGLPGTDFQETSETGPRSYILCPTARDEKRGIGLVQDHCVSTINKLCHSKKRAAFACFQVAVGGKRKEHQIESTNAYFNMNEMEKALDDMDFTPPQARSSRRY